MDQTTQNGGGMNPPSPPPGYSAADIRTGISAQTPNPVSSSSMPPPPPGYSAADIVQHVPVTIPQHASDSGGDSSAPQQSDEIQMNDNDGLLKGGAKALGSTLEGVGEGVFSGVAGLSDIADRVFGAEPGAANKYLHKLAGDDNTERGFYQKLGFGGETLAEFMLGDEALKALPLAKRLGIIAKWMDTAEKSPRLIAALRLGAGALKAGTELSPEEAQIVRQYPKLAKLVGLGMDSLRIGAVQAGQTTVRSGGDVKEGIKEGGEAALTAGALGAVTGGAAHVLGKARKAAQTVEQMGKVAESASSKGQVEQSLAAAVQNSFSDEQATMQGQLDNATSKISDMGQGAPQQSSITKAAQQYAKNGKQAVHDAYQGGLDQLTGMAGDTKYDYEDSPLHKAAQELDQAGKSKTGDLDEAFNIGRPGSERANRVIDKLLNVGKEGEAEAAAPDKWVDANGVEHAEEAAPVEEQGQPAKADMAHAVEYRQRISRLLRTLSPVSPDYRADKEIYQKLLSGVDEWIGKMADNVHDGDIQFGEDGEPFPSTGRQLFDKMNEDYRKGIQPFGNRDVKNILKGNLNDVSKSLMGGQTSKDDIDAVKKAIGPEAFGHVSISSLGNIVKSHIDPATGELDYKKLFKTFNRINPDVRQAMFGAPGKMLSDALQVADTAKGGLDDIEKRVRDLLGNGDINSILKNPQQAKDIANAVGPDGMKVLGQSILGSKVAEASSALDPKTGEIVKSRFDPDKVLDWWMSMKDNPEVRDSFFSVDKDSSKYYSDLMKNLSGASSVKKLVKYGVLPLTLGTAGVIHGPGAALIGALAGLGTEAGFGRAREILDAIANNPRTWKFLAGAGKVAETVDKPVARAATAKGVYSALSGALGGK